MARYFDILITGGTSPGPYSVYYNTVNPSNYATRSTTNAPATGITYNDLIIGQGVNVSIPDNSTSIILFNNLCTTGITYTLPIPSPTPTVTVSPSITPTITVTPSITPTITVTPSITPTNPLTPTPTVTPTITPTGVNCAPYNLDVSLLATDCSYSSGDPNALYLNVFSVGSYQVRLVDTLGVNTTAWQTDNNFFDGIPNGTYYAQVRSTSENACVANSNEFVLDCFGTFTITGVTSDCDLGTVSISVTGGTPNYSYSIDGGMTYSTPTGSTTYNTTFTGDSINVWVKDSTNNVQRWTQIDCNVTTYFVPVYLDISATGHILEPNNTQRTSEFSVVKAKNQTYSLTGVTSGNTIFLGWSFTNNENDTFITTQTGYTHTFLRERTVYGLFKNNTVYSANFCFTLTTSGYVLTCEEENTFCSNCTVTSKVYFKPIDFQNAKGVYGNIIKWYKDEALTTEVDNGYYRLPSTNNQNNTTELFMLNNGVPTSKGICGGCTPGKTPLTC